MSNGDNTSSEALSGLAMPDWMQTLQYKTSLDEAKALALAIITKWYPLRATTKLDLSSVEACVAIKNHDFQIVEQNAAMQYFFLRVESVPGREIESYAFAKTTAMTRSTDELIRDGIHSLEFECLGGDQDGRLYTIHTMKYRLAELKDLNYYLLMISRPTAFIGMSEDEKQLSLNELFRLFQSLDGIDQTICQLDADGETTKEIAATVGLTSRSIEIRRKKMLDVFQVQRPMELVRITIRLQEHGLLLG